uniref:Uncharacterized protein n=1 Tax=Timema bartmani TaxID=61472 RepID=A0A7R9F5V0_9NEOP|nr:unnamed protein product [Timema bartmani]
MSERHTWIHAGPVVKHPGDICILYNSTKWCSETACVKLCEVNNGRSPGFASGTRPFGQPLCLTETNENSSIHDNDTKTNRYSK